MNVQTCPPRVKANVRGRRVLCAVVDGIALYRVINNEFIPVGSITPDDARRQSEALGQTWDPR